MRIGSFFSKKKISYIVLLFFVLSEISPGYAQYGISDKGSDLSTLSVYSSFDLPVNESPEFYKGDILSNKRFVTTVMSLTKYLIMDNGTVPGLKKWIRHNLAGEYREWAGKIDPGTIDISSNSISFQFNFKDRQMAAEVSLRSDKISEGGFFSIDVRETGAEKGVSLKTSETAADIINKGKAVEIGFSILSSKEEDLVEEVNKVVEAGIDSIHIDHLDGNFTPGLPAFDCTWQIRKIAHIEVPLNVHLMSVAPSIELIDSLVEAGLKKGDLLLVHHESYDSFTEMEKNVRYIKERGLKAGIVINPETPIEDLQRVLEDLHGSLDAVMVMSIIPGAGSRPYIAGTEDKVRDIRRLLRVMGIRDRIKVILDGGLNQDSLASIIASGADDIITRTWLLSQKDSYRESLGYVRNLSRRRAEYICFKDMMEEWDLANYRFVIDAIAKFCSGDDTFTEEEILRTVKRYAGVNKVTIDDERVIDVFYKDKLVRFHKDEVIPIEYLGLRDRTYYDGTVVKIYTGNVMNREEGDYILGLSGSWHDSTAVLVKDGEIIAALEEERMTRQKHDPSLFPVNSILRLLEKNGITWKDIKHIALGWNFNLYVDTPHSANPNDIFFAQMDKEYAAEKGIDPEEVVRRRSAEKNKKRFNVERVYEFLRAMSETFNVDHEPKVSFVSHSRSHAASAYYTCGFKGKVLTLALDGYGDRESGSVWLCEDGRMEELARFRLPHSIGWMWCAVTEYLGFKPSAEEGQVMGFAPYGEPWDSVEMARVNKLREIFKDYMRFDPETQTLVSNPENYYYGEMLDGKIRITRSFQEKMEELGIRPYQGDKQSLDPNEQSDRPYANLAYVLQERTSQVICDIVRYYFTEHPRTKGLDKLALSGGVALNILSNGKLITEGMVYGENIFIQPAAGDSGIAIGASLTLSRELYGEKVDTEMEHAYYGPQYSNEEIERMLSSYGLKEGVDYVRATDEELVEDAAELINDSKAIAWFQGKSEIGPRALGARSILLNLNDVKANNTANIIKGRQYWRPSASSILDKYAKDYFMGIGKSPFMVIAFPILFKKKNLVLSGMHEFGDKLARPQTVSKKANPLYWKLLERLGEISGIPAVVNTSFNKQEPLVEDPEEALNTFYYMDNVDHLFLGNFIINKTDVLKPSIIALEYEKPLNTLIKRAKDTGDMNIWMKVFDLVDDLYPECHKIQVTMDCGQYGLRRFELPLVKELLSGPLKEDVLSYISACIFNHALDNSAKKIYIGSTSIKMRRVVYDLLKDRLTEEFPRMSYFCNYGRQVEIKAALSGDIARSIPEPKEPVRLGRISIYDSHKTLIGVDVGASSIKFVLLKNGDIVRQMRIPTTFKSGGELGELIREKAAEIAGGEKIDAIGISLPGVVDAAAQKIRWLVNYEHLWKEKEPSVDATAHYGALTEEISLLKKELGTDTINLMNDGTAFGYWAINSAHYDNAVVVVLGTGIGAARIKNGLLDISRIEQSGTFVIDTRKNARYDAGCEVRGNFAGILRDGSGKLMAAPELAEKMVRWLKLMNTMNGDDNFVLTGGVTQGEYGDRLMDEIQKIISVNRDKYPFTVTLTERDAFSGGAVGAAQMSVRMDVDITMDAVHNINMSMLKPFAKKGKKLNYLIVEELVPVRMRNKLKNFLEELYRKYPFLRSKEEIRIVRKNNMDMAIADILSRTDRKNIVNIALSDPGDVSGLPEGVKALVFTGSRPTDDLIQLEGVLAALRAMQQGDVRELIMVYEYLTGKRFDIDRVSVEELTRKITDPFALAKILTFELKPIQNLTNIMDLEQRLLSYIESSA